MNAPLATSELKGRLSPLVLGTMTFGAQTEEATARRMIDLALDAGITMIDTANVYAGGASEEIVGRSLEGRRDGVLVATKVGMPSPDGQGPPLSAESMRSCVEASLRRLRTDRVDVLYLHQPDRVTPVEETLTALDDLVSTDKVRWVGVSNYAAWQIAQLRNTAPPEVAPVVSQPLYNLLARRIEQEYAEYAVSTGLLSIVYNPLGGGLLTGKHRRDEPIFGTGRFGDNPLGQMYRERYWDDYIHDAVGELSEASAEAGLSLVETAFRWLLAQPVVDAVLVGASRLEHLTANLTAASGPALPSTLMDAADRVWATLGGRAPAYNR